jgi:hypothetical protein
LHLDAGVYTHFATQLHGIKAAVTHGAYIALDTVSLMMTTCLMIHLHMVNSR